MGGRTVRWTLGGLVLVVAACSGVSSPTVGPPESAPESAQTTEGGNSTTTAPAQVGDLDPKALLAAVRPSIALVTTPISQGSGVLIDGGYVVTNAHVVDPYGAATVDFESDAPIEDVPVVGIDPYADIALLGPLELELQPLPLAEQVELEQGDPVYLVGYPGEFDSAADVTMSSGLVSRLRDYAPFEQQYIQTDAAIGGGQSGGALVDGQGRVVGISGLSFAEQFALALSSPDVRRSIDAIVAGDTPEYRPLVDQPTITSGAVEVFNELHKAVLLLNGADEPRTLLLTIPESSSPTISVSDLTGELSWVNQPLMDQAVALDPSLSPTDVGDVLESTEPGQYSVDIPAGADVMIVLGTTLSSGASVDFESNLPLVQYEDSDDPGAVGPGETVMGVIDAFELEDGYEVDLEAGQTVTVRVSAAGGDPIFSFVPPGVDPREIEPVDDSGIGLYGLDAEDTFVAEQAGTYLIGVSVNDYFVTGYRLDVDLG